MGRGHDLRSPPCCSLPLALLLLLLLCAIHVLADEVVRAPRTRMPSATTGPKATTAPVYLPYYDERSWSLVRGSIISADPSASKTTYTIFCPTQTPAACDLSLEFPFVIVEGPETMQFHGTHTSTFIADVECRLDGTTAATCSGYSSWRSGYTNGFHTGGPSESSWTSTFTGSQVQWGALTLAEKPGSAAGDGLPINTAAAAAATPTLPSGMMYEPSSTSSSGADGSLRCSGWMILGLMGLWRAWVMR